MLIMLTCWSRTIPIPYSTIKFLQQRSTTCCIACKCQGLVCARQPHRLEVYLRTEARVVWQGLSIVPSAIIRIPNPNWLRSLDVGVATTCISRSAVNNHIRILEYYKIEQWRAWVSIDLVWVSTKFKEESFWTQTYSFAPFFQQKEKRGDEKG